MNVEDLEKLLNANFDKLEKCEGEDYQFSILNAFKSVNQYTYVYWLSDVRIVPEISTDIKKKVCKCLMSFFNRFKMGLPHNFYFWGHQNQTKYTTKK